MEEKEPKKKSPLDDLKKNENVKKVLDFAESNTGDMITYIALFIGILLLFFKEFWGGFIIGAIGGFHFADLIIAWLRDFQNYLEREGLVKVLILVGVALGFLIVAPSFFIGAAAAVGLRYLLKS